MNARVVSSEHAISKNVRPNLLAELVHRLRSRPEDLVSIFREEQSMTGFVWLTYAEASAYTGWSIAYLRNLVSAGLIPVYGKPRVRRFRRDMLDCFLADPDVAMRKFRWERERAT